MVIHSRVVSCAVQAFSLARSLGLLALRFDEHGLDGAHISVDYSGEALTKVYLFG